MVAESEKIFLLFFNSLMNCRQNVKVNDDDSMNELSDSSSDEDDSDASLFKK